MSDKILCSYDDQNLATHLIVNNEGSKTPACAVCAANAAVNGFKIEKMHTPKLEPGYYVLKQDVKNPNADRRSKNWTSLPMWKAGERFVVATHTLDTGGVRAKIHKVGQREYIHEYTCFEQFDALYPHLEQIPDTVPSLYEQFGMFSYHPYVVAAALVERGLIKIEDLKRVLKALDEGEEAEIELTDHKLFKVEE